MRPICLIRKVCSSQSFLPHYMRLMKKTLKGAHRKPWNCRLDLNFPISETELERTLTSRNQPWITYKASSEVWKKNARSLWESHKLHRLTKLTLLSNQLMITVYQNIQTTWFTTCRWTLVPSALTWSFQDKIVTHSTRFTPHRLCQRPLKFSNKTTKLSPHRS